MPVSPSRDSGKASPRAANLSWDMFGRARTQQLAHPDAGLVQLRLGCADGQAEDAGNFAVPIPLHIVEEKYLLVPFGHFRDRALDVQAVNGAG